MKLAYTCACIYCLDKYQQSRGSMYSQIYLDYVRDTKKGFSLHLVVIIAKENNVVVPACDDCLKKIVHRLCILPEYPENIGYVCNRFHVCYSRVCACVCVCVCVCVFVPIHLLVSSSCTTSVT